MTKTPAALGQQSTTTHCSCDRQPLINHIPSIDDTKQAPNRRQVTFYPSIRPAAQLCGSPVLLAAYRIVVGDQVRLPGACGRRLADENPSIFAGSSRCPFQPTPSGRLPHHSQHLSFCINFTPRTHSSQNILASFKEIEHCHLPTSTVSPSPSTVPCSQLARTFQLLTDSTVYFASDQMIEHGRRENFSSCSLLL